MTDRGHTVGVILTAHPHTVAHLRTLDVLPDVEAIHVAVLEGLDLSTLDVPTRKVVRTYVSTTASPLSRRDGGGAGGGGLPVAPPDVNTLRFSSSEAALAGLFSEAASLDAVIVCVRTDLCPAVLDACIDAGVPALFEKPGALDAATLHRLDTKARSAGISLGTFLSWRAHPAVVQVRDAVRDGAIGHLLGVEGRMVTSQVRFRDPSHWLFRRATAGSGILSWLGCHFLDALCFMIDDEVAEVTAFVGTRNPEAIEVEDTACLALRFRGGALGTFNAGYHLVGSVPGYMGASYDTFLALRGTSGFARLPLSEGASATLMSEAPGWREGGRREWRYDLPASSAYHGVPGEEFVRQFLKASRARTMALAPIGAIAHILDIVEAAIRSSETGKAQRVVQAPRG
ncbi:MAG: Gfo/Idh/MocA family oxidoreductase [Chloroflexi bacterium]|nr:Gfo/Idh/MocA family oxidoreductase [Chloroflexota bacterium]